MSDIEKRVDEIDRLSRVVQQLLKCKADFEDYQASLENRILPGTVSGREKEKLARMLTDVLLPIQLSEPFVSEQTCMKVKADYAQLVKKYKEQFEPPSKATAAFVAKGMTGKDFFPAIASAVSIIDDVIAHLKGGDV